MTCLLLGHGVWKEVLVKEEAAHQTNTMQTLDEDFKHSKGMHCKPPTTYGDLCIVIDTFAALLWTLFGNECDYYKKIMFIRTILQSDSVQLQGHFTKYVIKSNVWVIIDDGRKFFNHRLHKLLSEKDPISYPISLLNDIHSDIHFIKPVDHIHFPASWKPPPSTASGTPLPCIGSHGTSTVNTLPQPNKTPQARHSTAWGQNPTSSNTTSRSSWNRPPSIPPPSSWGPAKQWTNQHHLGIPHS